MDSNKKSSTYPIICIWIIPALLTFWLGDSTLAMVFATIWLIGPPLLLIWMIAIILNHPGETFSKEHILYRILYKVRDNKPKSIDICSLPEDMIFAAIANIAAIIISIIIFCWGILNAKKYSADEPVPGQLLYDYDKWPLVIKGRRITPIWFLTVGTVIWVILNYGETTLLWLSTVDTANLPNELILVASVAFAIVTYKAANKYLAKLGKAWSEVSRSYKEKYCLRKAVK